jgi:hypothetical protein
METIKLPVHNITIRHDGKSGTITSALHDGWPRGGPLGAALNAIESIVLAHAIAGVDVTTPAYLEGIETAVDAISNQE